MWFHMYWEKHADLLFHSLNYFNFQILKQPCIPLQNLPWHDVLSSLCSTGLNLLLIDLAFIRIITIYFLIMLLLGWINKVNQVKLIAAAAAAKSLQSCPTLCDPIDGSPPGSAVPGILQARTLEWVAISFSNAWKRKAKGKSLSRVQLLATPWTAAYQAPPSMGFSRQEYWSGVPLPSP